jgi:hypothetical protein
MTHRHRAVAWVKDDPFGVEFAEIQLAAQQLSATGVAIGSRPVPYRLDYSLDTTRGFVTSRLRVSSIGEGWRRSIDLQRDKAGIWSITADQDGDVELPAAGGDPGAFANTLDCDLGLSPVTNLMPILRNDLLAGGGPVELTTAWVSVPDLSVRPDSQRYLLLRMSPDERVIRFEATDGTFTADIAVDADGVVIDYPGIARRLLPAAHDQH